jgi:hypothetical protein
MVLMSFVNNPIVPIPLGFREHDGIGSHEKPPIPPCSIADGTLTGTRHRRSKKARNRLRWNNARAGKI